MYYEPPQTGKKKKVVKKLKDLTKRKRNNTVDLEDHAFKKSNQDEKEQGMKKIIDPINSNKPNPYDE